MIINETATEGMAMTTKESLFDLWKRREVARNVYNALGWVNVAPNPDDPNDDRRRFEIDLAYRKAGQELLEAEIAYSNAEKSMVGQP